jgi:succinate dehydrogenase cytochrome b subunit
MQAEPKQVRYRRTFYRGGGSLWSWIFHRASGLAVLGFLFLHIIDTSLVGFGPAHYNNFVRLYQKATFRWLEVLLMGLVIFHALNGLRVILVDFWAKGARYHRQLNSIVIFVSLALFLPAAYFMVKPLI